MSLVPEMAAPQLDSQRIAAPVEQLDLLVVVGTDHHPFDRLVRWADQWVEQQSDGCRAIVQHGTSREPRVATGRSLFEHDELQEMMGRATVLIMHGGPASIMEARRLGKVPVVVPRSPHHGEHVDGHQLRFTRRLGELGLIALCETQQDFVRVLTEAKEDPATLQVTEVSSALGGNGDRTEAMAAVRHIVDDLIARGPAHERFRVRPLRWHGRHSL